MLDLATNEVRDYWVKADPELAALFDRLDRTEDWTLDGTPAIGARVIALGELVSATPEAAMKLAQANRDTLLFFFAYISTARAFRLTRWMDEEHNGLGARLLERLLTESGTDIVASVVDPVLTGIMIQRLRVLQNTPYFTRLLDPSLIDGIERAISRYREEVAHEEL